MKEFKGTPGPWHVSNENNLIIRDDTWYIPVCSSGYRENDEELANANLIAAAPELLESLKNIIIFIESGTQSDIIYAVDDSKNVINKALGIEE